MADNQCPSNQRYVRSNKGKAVRRQITIKHQAKLKFLQVAFDRDDLILLQFERCAIKDGRSKSAIVRDLIRRWVVERTPPD
jgi:hypothetical protein